MATTSGKPAWTPGPWAFKEGDKDRRAMSDVFRADDEDFRIGYVVCEWANPTARRVDIATARLIAAAPALALAWELVPEEIKGRIFDALHRPDTAWVESAISGLDKPV